MEGPTPVFHPQPQENIMRFMIIAKANADTEARPMHPEERTAP